LAKILVRRLMVSCALCTLALSCIKMSNLPGILAAVVMLVDPLVLTLMSTSIKTSRY